MHYKFLGKYARKVVAPLDVEVDYDEINVVPYFYSVYRKGTACEHTHEFWELLFVIKGPLENVINGKKYVLNEKAILLVKPQDKHRSYTRKGSFAEFYNFEIRESFFQQLLESIDKSLFEEVLSQENIYIECDEIMFQQLRSLMAHINTMKEKDYREKQRYLQIVIARIISELLLRKTGGKRGYFLIEEIFTYMRDPEKMNCTLAELAQSFGYCSEHILRIFKKNGLDSPSKEWKKIKLKFASELLTDTSKTIMEISEMIGIANINYFSKIFKEFFGESPSMYRKNHKIKQEELYE